MTLEEQRAWGQTLAQDAGAPRTLAAIRDPDQCFEDILSTALDEVGAERLAGVLVQGDPIWSYQALRRLPALQPYRAMLLQKSAESAHAAIHTLRFVDDLGDHEGALRASAAPLFASAATLDNLEFVNEGAYVAYFAMKWIHMGLTHQVTRGLYGGGRRWPGTELGLAIGGIDKLRCEDFARVSGLPLAAGDEIWVFMQADVGDNAETPQRFTYQPGVARRGTFVATGTVRSVGLQFASTSPA